MDRASGCTLDSVLALQGCYAETIPSRIVVLEPDYLAIRSVAELLEPSQGRVSTAVFHGNEYQYYRRYQGSDAGTPTWRTIPVRRTIRTGQKILDSEEAHAIIDASVRAALVPCPCRTRTEKLGIRECRDKNPVAACIMLGLSALHFETAGLGKPVSKKKAKAYMDDMQKAGLMVTTENFTDINHAVICLCCECCCSMIRGRTRWDNPAAVLPSNFIPRPDDNCVYCGRCEKKCPLGAIVVDKHQKRFFLNEGMCIGCGVCTTACQQDALKLVRQERSVPRKDARDMYNTIYIENRVSKGAE